jgi:hypothetical protein
MLRTAASARETDALRGPLTSAEGWSRLGMPRSARVIDGRVSRADPVRAPPSTRSFSRNKRENQTVLNE